MTAVPTNVLFVTTEFDKVANGPALYARNIWRFFEDDPEFNLHVVALQSVQNHPRIHTLPKIPSGRGSLIYRAVEEVATEVYDKLGSQTIVHVNMAHLISPAFAARSRAIVQVNDTEVCQWHPSIQLVRTYGWRRNAALWWRKRRERRVTKKARLTVCNSDFTRKTVRDTYGIPDERITTIYKAVDLAPFRSAARQRSDKLHADTTRIAFVGSNWLRKGLDVLLCALAHLRTTSTRPFSLAVYGDDSSVSNSRFIFGLIENLGIDDVVAFHGQISRSTLPETLAKADMFALPSREEALGVSIIEALAVGLPVVASRVGGIPEIVKEDCQGVLVEPGNPNALAKAILEVAERTYDSQDQQARSNSVNHFDVLQLEMKLRKLYRSASSRD